MVKKGQKYKEIYLFMVGMEFLITVIKPIVKMLLLLAELVRIAVAFIMRKMSAGCLIML